MKITEKIVTSVTQPQQTNVLWHNPETGELKMFGNKGWTSVSGGSTNTPNGGIEITVVGASGITHMMVSGYTFVPDFSCNVDKTTLVVTNSNVENTKLILPQGVVENTLLIL